MAEEYIRKKDAIAVAESYQVERTGFHLNDYEYGRNQVADSIASDLEDIEPADVVPVVHGKWINGRCNKCGEHAPFWAMASTYYTSNFCPNCGAKMDGGK